jgi:hypothetical protein
MREENFDFENHPETVYLSGARQLKLAEVISNGVAVADKIDTFHDKISCSGWRNHDGDRIE